MNETDKPRYSRVVVKLSGEALAGPSGWGVDPTSLGQLADELLSVHELGVELAVVIGGGNYFRGRMAQGWGIGRAEADNIGMLGTVMNALMLRGALTARTDNDVRVMTAVPMESIAEPFIRQLSQARRIHSPAGRPGQCLAAELDHDPRIARLVCLVHVCPLTQKSPVPGSQRPRP